MYFITTWIYILYTRVTLTADARKPVKGLVVVYGIVQGYVSRVRAADKTIGIHTYCICYNILLLYVGTGVRGR